MTIRIVSFLAIVFTALALVPGGAHLFALLNKIGMSQDQYFVAQMAYRGWWMMAFILIPAMVTNLLFAFLLRDTGAPFWLAVIACVCMALTLAIFFTWTYPANVETQNWTVAPAHWEALRQQWEYSHAASAAMNFIALCLIVLASLGLRR